MFAACSCGNPLPGYPSTASHVRAFFNRSISHSKAPGRTRLAKALRIPTKPQGPTSRSALAVTWAVHFCGDSFNEQRYKLINKQSPTAELQPYPGLWIQLRSIHFQSRASHSRAYSRTVNPNDAKLEPAMVRRCGSISVALFSI